MKQTFTRAFRLDTATQGTDDTVNIAISTETPFLRYDFAGFKMAYEVLSHSPEDVDLSEVAGDAAPFCFEHCLQNQLGVLKNVSLDADGVLRADVLFSLAQQAQDIKSDMLRGVRKRISVGYEILSMTEVGTAEDGIPIIRCQFRPYEASTVSIAADNTAGVGRSNDITPEKPNMNEDEIKAMIDAAVEARMGQVIADQKKATETDVSEQDAQEEAQEEATAEASDTENSDDELVTPQEAEASPTNEEQDMKDNQKSAAPSAAHIKEVTELATRYNKIDALPVWLSENRTIAEIKAEVLDSRSNNEKVRTPAIVIAGKRENNFAGAVKAWLRNDSSELAERGMAQQRLQGMAINPYTLYLPTDVDMIRSKHVRSAYGAGVGAGAGATGKEFLSWEETLREVGVSAKAGVEIRPASDVLSLPYWSAPTTASVVQETGSVSVQTTTVGVRTWTPKRIAARYKFTNMLGVLNGTYDFEAELTNDLLNEGASRFDRQIFAGAGGVEVTGLINDSNIAAYAPTGALDLTNGNAIVSILANNNVNSLLSSTTFVVDHNAFGYASAQGAFQAGSGQSTVQALTDAGYTIIRTGFLPKLSGGTKAQLIAGEFSKVTAATFGSIAIERDTFTQAATGETVLNMQFFMDSAARNPLNLVKWSNITVFA